MELIPAIDILGGKVVRLERGNYDAVTVYDDNPVACAERFAAAGAIRLHVVDLDGARDGKPVNVAAVAGIVTRTSLMVQTGGGIRDLETARAWLDEGCARVVLGTAAVENPDVCERLCRERPGSVVVALDARGSKVAVRGWLEETDVSVHDLAKIVDGWGAAAILYTDIQRDGMREGPNVAATAALQALVRADVIASGGIGRLDDLAALAAAGVRSAVCGRALYSGAFSLADAFAFLRRGES